MNSTTNKTVYCDLKHFEQVFRDYYIYLSLLVCIFGSITNVLNICVLTSKQMRCATNLILTGLAAADLLVMVEYVPFIIVYNTGRKYATHYTYNFAVFVLFHALFTQAFHFIACCHTVILAIWRYVAVKFPQNVVAWCGNNITKVTIFLTYLLCPIVCIPLYLSLSITGTTVKMNETTGILLPNNTNTSDAVYKVIYLTGYKRGFFQLMGFYVYSVVLKFVPCVLLTILSCLLIVELLKAKERRQKLLSSSATKENGNKTKEKRHIEKEKQADRTTRMLLTVLLLFLMVEFPQAIFGLLNHIVGETFDIECYRPLGDLLDLFTLINSAINFVLYCIMSKKFREVFQQVFIPSFIPGFKPKESWTSLHTLKTYV